MIDPVHSRERRVPWTRAHTCTGRATPPALARLPTLTRHPARTADLNPSTHSRVLTRHERYSCRVSPAGHSGAGWTGSAAVAAGRSAPARAAAVPSRAAARATRAPRRACGFPPGTDRPSRAISACTPKAVSRVSRGRSVSQVRPPLHTRSSSTEPRSSSTAARSLVSVSSSRAVVFSHRCCTPHHCCIKLRSALRTARGRGADSTARVAWA